MTVISLRLAYRLLIYSLLWWLLTAGNTDSWIVGGPVVIAAAALAERLSGDVRWRCSLLGCLRFAPYFLRDSLIGGLDVARRSLHPRLPIDPQMIEYDLRLPAGTARAFYMNAINLLPGTVSADLRDGNTLVLHVIDGRQPVHRQLSELEQRVAGVFAIRIELNESEGAALP